MLQAIDTVLFDLYGTLIDVTVAEHPASVWCQLRAYLGRLGLTAPDDLQQHFYHLCEVVARTQGPESVLEPVFSQLLEEGGARPVAPDDIAAIGAAFRQASVQRLTVRAYTAPLLQRLREGGVRVAVVSNTEAVLTRYDMETLRLDEDFDAVVLSSDVGAGKPDPAIMRVALDAVGAVPARAVMVGDTWETDVAAAQAAGMPAIFLDRTATAGTASFDRAARIARAHPDHEAIVEALRLLDAG